MGYQSIYDRFRANGFTEAGALAMLGNFDCESNCISYRLQGDFNYPYNASRQYTADVDSGKIDRKQFMNDGRGYGLAQWTWFPRKGGLYDYCMQRGYSIGDESTQVQYSIIELKADFPSLLQELQTSNDLYQCTKDICYRFENPEIKNVDARFAAAKRIQGEIDLDGGGDDPEPAPTPDPTPGPEPEPEKDHRLDLRTIDENCSGFDEVFLLQSALICRRYFEGTPSNIFGSWLEEIVKKFQADSGLVADGIVGPLTWGRLLEVGK